MTTDEPTVAEIRYATLLRGVNQLLCELRICPKCLRVMANGYSPNIFNKERGWKECAPAVQLSSQTAEAIIAGGVEVDDPLKE